MKNCACADLWQLEAQSGNEYLSLPERLPGTGTEPIPATPIDKIELILQKLHDRKAAWVQTSTQERAMLLRKTITTTVQVMKTAATVSTHAKGVYGGGIGEE